MQTVGEGVCNLNESGQEAEISRDLIEARFWAIAARHISICIAPNKASGWQPFQSRHDPDRIRSQSYVIAETPILVNARLMDDIFKDSI